MGSSARMEREDSLGFHGGLAQRAWLSALENKPKPFGLSPSQIEITKRVLRRMRDSLKSWIVYTGQRGSMLGS